MSYYTIYKTTNKVNGRYYIGQHKTDDPYDTYIGSGTLLKKSIEKYGIKNFHKEVLFIFDNKEDCNLKEKELVNYTDPNSYNLMEGGCGGWNYVNSSGKNRIYGPRNKTTKTALKNSHWSKKENSKKIKEKIGNSNKGKKLSAKAKKTISEKALIRFKDPEYVKMHSKANSKRIITPDKIFSSVKETAEYYKISSSAVCNRIKSRNFVGWEYCSAE